MLVYLVHHDNSEMYEDNYEYVCAAFSSEEKAIRYIEEEGYGKRTGNKYWDNHPTWCRKAMDVDEDGEGYFTGITESMWIETMEVQ